jgi:hypothetical protein
MRRVANMSLARLAAADCALACTYGWLLQVAHPDDRNLRCNTYFFEPPRPQQPPGGGGDGPRQQVGDMTALRQLAAQNTQHPAELLCEFLRYYAYVPTPLTLPAIPQSSTAGRRQAGTTIRIEAVRCNATQC